MMSHSLYIIIKKQGCRKKWRTWLKKRRGRFCHKKRRLHIHIEMGIVKRFIYIRQRPVTGETSIQNEDIDPSKRFDRFSNQQPSSFHSWSIGFHGYRSSFSLWSNRLNDVLSGFGIFYVVDDDVCPVFSETLCYSCANGTRRARNDGYFAYQYK